MKNVVLSENDAVKLIAKIYVDGSIKLIQRWKNSKLSDEKIFLMSTEVEILKDNLN